MVLNETFHRQPAIRALVPVVDIVCIRELALETETVSGALALHLRTKRGAVDTTAEGLVGDVVVVVVVVYEVHLVVLLDGTDQRVQVINILYSVLEYDVDRAANRNRVDVELSTILVHTNAIRRFQRNRTVTGKAALQAQILDCDRSNIVVLCCQTVALVLVGDCNGNSHLLSNLRVGRAVAVLHRVRQMANRIGGQTIVAVCFDDAVIAVRIVPSQLLTGIAVSIGANIGLSVQGNSVVVGDVINVDIPLPLFTDSGIVVGVIYLDVVRVDHRILVVILLGLGIAGNIDVFTFTSKNRFVCLFDSHVLTIVRHCVSQILVVSDIIGVSIIVPLVFVRVMVLTVNIQRTRVDGSGEIFFCNIVVVKRVVDKFKNRNRLDAVQTRMELLSEARCCVIFGSVCVAVVTVCQTSIQVNSVAIDDTGVLSRSFNLNILHFSSADIVVNLVVIIAVQIQRARVNVEVDDIALTRHILVRSCALTAYHIGLAGECIFPAECNVVLCASVNCCSSIRTGTNERLLLAVSRSIGGLCNVCGLVVGVYDVDIIENALRNACVSLVPNDRLCNGNGSAIVHLIRNGQLDFDIGRMAFVGILETNIHCVLADTTVQALVKVYNLDFCATCFASIRTIVVCGRRFNDDVAVFERSRFGNIGCTTSSTGFGSSFIASAAAAFVSSIIQLSFVFSICKFVMPGKFTAVDSFCSADITVFIGFRTPITLDCHGFCLCAMECPAIAVMASTASANSEASVSIGISATTCCAGTTACNADKCRSVSCIVFELSIYTGKTCCNSCRAAATTVADRVHTMVSCVRCTMTFIVFIVCKAVILATTGTARATTVVTTVTARSVTGVFPVNGYAATSVTSTTGNKIERCAFFDVSSNGYMSTAFCGRGRTVFSEILRQTTAASAPQVNLVSCIERCGPRRILVAIAAVIGTEVLVSSTDILLINVEKHLFVGSVIFFPIIAMIFDGIAPEPLPDFFRIRIVGMQRITILQVRSIVFIRVFQPATSINFNAQFCHCFALNINGFPLIRFHINARCFLHRTLIADRCVDFRLITR